MLPLTAGTSQSSRSRTPTVSGCRVPADDCRGARQPRVAGRCFENLAVGGRRAWLFSAIATSMFVPMRSIGPNIRVRQRVFLVCVIGILLLDAAASVARERQGSPEPRLEARASVERRLPPHARAQDPERTARDLLLGAKDALSSGNVAFLRPHFGQKVYLNLFTGINGYYSAGQAALILESFFSAYRPISFSFSSRNFSIRNPYGFGPITLTHRGKRETAEMFLSLANVHNRWMISQITIAKR